MAASATTSRSRTSTPRRVTPVIRTSTGEPPFPRVGFIDESEPASIAAREKEGGRHSGSRAMPDLTDETSIAHFCEFIAYYTRHASDPLRTALACEKQAEGVQISEQEVTPETIRLLLETMVTAIDHLEKKWLDEQIRREEEGPFAPVPPQMFPDRGKSLPALRQWVQHYFQRPPLQKSASI